MNKRIIKTFAIGLISLLAINESNAQTIGVGASVGTYTPKFTNSVGSEESVTGTGIWGLNAFTELSIKNSKSAKLPISIQYSSFGTKFQLNAIQNMENKAQSLSVDLGFKYFFGKEESKMKPFCHVSAAYEGIIKSTYYLDEFQNGDLDWKSNAFANIAGGFAFKTAENVRIDLYGKASIGMLNRLSVGSIYKDNFFTMGANIVFMNLK